MAGLTCPSCGVAVTPGYVRCPKCKKTLPVRRATTGVAQGGTAVPTKRNPWLPVAVVAIAVIVIGGIWQGRKAFSDYRTKTLHVRDAAVSPTAPTPDQSAPAAGGASLAPAPSPAAGPTAPSGDALAAELDRRLKHLHLWATVEVVGDHVDVRSESCGDPAIRPVLDRAAGGFKTAGLSRLRCLDQSGTVVFQRDL